MQSNSILVEYSFQLHLYCFHSDLEMMDLFSYLKNGLKMLRIKIDTSNTCI